MKKTWKLAFAAFALFAFTACGGEENTTTETEAVEGVESEMETEMNMETEDTTVLEDTTVNDGVADDIEEEQPPIE
ncbi:hypothetical protein [Pontibacter akesuensis]|uniref:Uncharacterized protein n=1 Tax=Pontibacter akesuensis TaxID=388950 RepID=A0A1I7JPG3_9BACT|nr:hypothetical protein [Pontibacter akesuensis]SFU87038.1 hypothetical protein SAMN04487941_3094 [Pontibacter akesuensis]